ncbi:polymorphic toxin type 50 domain-containing protein, partial [Bacillus cereus]
SNFLTIVAEVGTGGLASPIVIPLDIAATAIGASLFVHGGFVWNKSIQNTKDTIQKIQSSGGGKGASNRIPSYGKDSVPKGPYREVNGYPIKVKAGAQEKHIPDTPNYKQELANGKNKSIFYGDNKIAQELLDKFAGKGELLKNGRERVDFGEPIGKYYDRNTGEYHETTKGLIHYGLDGAHIVPSRP